MFCGVSESGRVVSSGQTIEVGSRLHDLLHESGVEVALAGCNLASGLENLSTKNFRHKAHQ